jgi:hypothetical protein
LAQFEWSFEPDCRREPDAMEAAWIKCPPLDVWLNQGVAEGQQPGDPFAATAEPG